VTEDHPRKRLDLDIPKRVPLVLREVSYLLLRKANVVEIGIVLSSLGRVTAALQILCHGAFLI
jgi:hypothetical protein